jgi:hypothetical protein
MSELENLVEATVNEIIIKANPMVDAADSKSFILSSNLGVAL